MDSTIALCAVSFTRTSVGPLSSVFRFLCGELDGAVPKLPSTSPGLEGMLAERRVARMLGSISGKIFDLKYRDKTFFIFLQKILSHYGTMQQMCAG